MRNVKANQNITANFDINRYTITFVARSHGRISGDTKQSVVYGGGTSEVGAIPDHGYHFVKWTGTNGFITSTANPLKLDNVKADQKITAVFSR